MTHPFVSPELIAYLDTIHPDVMPSGPIEDINGFHTKLGAILLIRHLKTLLEEQEEKLSDVFRTQGSDPASPAAPA